MAVFTYRIAHDTYIYVDILGLYAVELPKNEAKALEPPLFLILQSVYDTNPNVSP